MDFLKRKITKTVLASPNRSAFQTKFGEILEKLNFAGDPDGSRARINSFIANATLGEIVDFLSPSDVSEATNMIIGSAAYFHGTWQHVLDPLNTSPQPFYGLTGVGNVQMMHDTGVYYFGHNEELKADVVHLPYVGNVTMAIVLPAKKNQLPDEFRAFVEVATNASIPDLIDGLQRHVINIRLPVMSFDETYSLDEVSSELHAPSEFYFSALTLAKRGNFFAPNAEQDHFNVRSFLMEETCWLSAT